jgi:hypothetical protein
MDKIFDSVAKDRNAYVSVERITNGGAFLSEYDAPAHNYGKALQAKLAEHDDYDAVILQEQSTRPVDDYGKFEAAVTSLKAKIESTQKDAEIYLYATWGYPSVLNEAKYGGSVPAMEQKLRTAYETLGEELGLPVSPVGTAFTKVFEDTSGTINLYDPDKKHPSYAGSYLSACVHAAKILGVDPREITFSGSLSAQDADVLRQAAYAAVS